MASAQIPKVIHPLDRDSLLVGFAGKVSSLVAFSSLMIGAVMLAHLTDFPNKAYKIIPQTVWGTVFDMLGVAHLILLRRWWNGKGSNALANIHLWTWGVSLLFAAGSFWSAFANHTGFLVCVFVLGGAVLALLTSRLAVWRANDIRQGR